jgi:hypothetical protein
MLYTSLEADMVSISIKFGAGGIEQAHGPKERVGEHWKAGKRRDPMRG